MAIWTFSLWIVAWATTARAAEQFVINTGKAIIEVVPDRDSFLATEPITGKLVFQLTEVRDKGGVAVDTVRMHQLSLSIVFPDEMAAVLPRVQWKAPVIPTLKVGHRYEWPFVIRMDESFEKLVRRGKADIVLFNAGRHRLSAVVDAPVALPHEKRAASNFVTLHQTFTSGQREITINAAAGGKVVDNDEVQRILREADGPLKHTIVSFYARRSVLSREDVLAAIEASGGKAKADLAALYLALNHPASDLKFFDLASGTIRLKGHDGGPLYLLVRPQQRIHFACELSSVHRLRVAHLDRVLANRETVDFDAPRAEGVYEMYDEANGKAWGWVLVRADKQAVAGAGLRPDTSELSAKVVQALIKQDADALAALAAPGFKAKEVVRAMRFKLGEGDVRYHESTGTTNKVRTVMKVNLAPAGEKPVFARELWLDYVRVGEELRLTQVGVSVE